MFKCVICADVILSNEEVKSTFCGHIFHFKCITQWLKSSSISYSCPQCRKSFDSDDPASKPLCSIELPKPREKYEAISEVEKLMDKIQYHQQKINEIRYLKKQFETQKLRIMKAIAKCKENKSKGAKEEPRKDVLKKMPTALKRQTRALNYFKKMKEKRAKIQEEKAAAATA